MLNKFFFAVLGFAFVLVCAMSFTFSTDELPESENATITSEAMAGNSDNCCCPNGWLLTILEGPEDPGAKWDNNEDGWLCFRSGFENQQGPHGNGNDPLYDESVIKDNNNPCKDGEFSPCEETP